MQNAPKSAIVVARLMKTRDAAAYLGASSWKVRKLVQDGHLSYISDSDHGGWWFDIKDLDRYIESNKRNWQ